MKTEIKLIVSDLDGTLLQNGAQALNQRAIADIEKLQKRGIIFAAASGRQYPNLKRLFGSLGKDMVFICENGAFVMYQEKILLQNPIERELGSALIKDIYQRKNCEVLLSGKYTSYLQPKTESYLYRMRDVVKNDITLVEDLTKVEEAFLKISVYQAEGIEHSEEYFKQKWGEKVQTTISGKQWMDFTALGVNKGTALELIQEKLKIEKSQTMVFGDNFNDIEMLERAKQSFVMESAKEEIKACGTHITKTVEEILEDLERKLEDDKINCNRY